jgi:hypothetical protein
LGPDEPTTVCPGCQAPYHAECWEYNGGCGVYGCSHVPPTEHLDSLEIPAAYWGREEKPCPVCDQTILAAALRCRHCGATFASAKPEDRSAYRSRAVSEQKQPTLKRTGTWILVLGLIPCTAALAAIVGSLWYVRNRRDIQALPALHAALCKVGVGVAVGQTAMLIVVTLLYGMFRG